MTRSLLEEFQEFKRSRGSTGANLEMDGDAMPRKNGTVLNMKIWRYAGTRDAESKGGIGIYARCPAISAMMRDMAGGSGETRVPDTFLGGKNVDKVKIYNVATPDRLLECWPVDDGVRDGGTYYHPTFNPVLMPLDARHSRVSLAPLLLADLDKGATIRIEGLYSQEMIERYAAILPVFVRRYFKYNLKKGNVFIYVSDREMSLAA